MRHVALLSLLLLGCAQADRAVAIGSNPFQLVDAEKILGEHAYLSDSSSSWDQSLMMYKCTFTANDTDRVTQKLGNLYCMIERHSDVRSADKLYDEFRSSNDHLGASNLNGIGDEAYYHSDGNNFCMVIARKGEKMIRMKVNKKTSKTSPEALKEIAARIVSEM